MVGTRVAARIVGAPATRARLLRFAAVAAGVAALHGWALRDAESQTMDGAAAKPSPAPAAVKVRAVAAPEPAPAPAAAVAPAPAPSPPPPKAKASPARAPAKAAAPAAEGAAASASAPSAGGDVPVYATRLPPPFHWVYDLKRGFITGRGDLTWAPGKSGYEAKLEGRVASFVILDWVSRGTTDAAGIAPERFVIRKKGRDANAANFQRAAGKLTWSGSTSEQPLVPGMQDRLSVMVQIAGIVAADPARFSRTSERIRVFVSGARADADLWTFDVLGLETVQTSRGAVRAVHVRREPRKQYDTRVDFWLDPARPHGPVRAELRNATDDEALELLLQDDNPAS